MDRFTVIVIFNCFCHSTFALFPPFCCLFAATVLAPPLSVELFLKLLPVLDFVRWPALFN